MNIGSQLKERVKKFEPLLCTLKEGEFSFKSSPEKWSKKEILGHLIDSALNNHRRIMKATQQDHLILEGYVQDHWVKQNNYQQRSPEEIINLWVSMNIQLAEAVENIPEEVLYKSVKEHNFDKICMQEFPQEKEATLAYLMEDYLFHVDHHLNQILNPKFG
ncbi:MAG: DinB family protein [Saprospiraceae bacterium]|nr:DinB family protein [Saprospiraceae bacterium]